MRESLPKTTMIARKATPVTYRFLLTIAMVAIFFLAITPMRIPIADGINDKVKHAVAFCVLALFVDNSFPARDLRFKAITLIAYGLAIEITQSFLPYRSCSLFDLGADVAGLVFYSLLMPWLTRVPLKKKRQKSE